MLYVEHCPGNDLSRNLGLTHIKKCLRYPGK